MGVNDCKVVAIQNPLIIQNCFFTSSLIQMHRTSPPTHDLHHNFLLHLSRSPSPMAQPTQIFYQKSNDHTCVPTQVLYPRIPRKVAKPSQIPQPNTCNNKLACVNKLQFHAECDYHLLVEHFV